MSHKGTEEAARISADMKTGVLNMMTLTARQKRRVLGGGRKQRKTDRPTKKAIKRVYRKAGKQRK